MYTKSNRFEINIIKIFIFMMFIVSSICATESNEIQVHGLGVEMSPPTLRILEECKLKSSYGVMIHKIDKDSFAEKNEIMQGDLIISINEKIIYSMNDLRVIMNSINSNDKLKILLFRNKTPKIIEGNYIETHVVSSEFDNITEAKYRSWTNKMLVIKSNAVQNNKTTEK